MRHVLSKVLFLRFYAYLLFLLASERSLHFLVLLWLIAEPVQLQLLNAALSPLARYARGHNSDWRVCVRHVLSAIMLLPISKGSRLF